jgi:soluble lytic murein transglycosylase-like protein
MPVLFSICLIFQQHYDLSNYQKRTICKLEPVIRAAAQKNNIEAELLAALIFVESSYHQNVVSSANACGLTQVVPRWTGGKETKKIKYTCKQLKNPITSIKVGAQILSYNTRVYAKGHEDKGLCFYNAGTKCITKKGFYKRSDYVKKVRRIYNKLIDGC